MAQVDTYAHPLAPTGTTASLRVDSVYVFGYTIVPSNEVSPVVSNLVPPASSGVLPKGSIGFDVTDDSGLASVLLWARFDGYTSVELIYDGASFTYDYDQGSTVSVISGGFRFSLKRRGGWPGNPTITPYAGDTAGNEVE